MWCWRLRDGLIQGMRIDLDLVARKQQGWPDGTRLVLHWIGMRNTHWLFALFGERRAFGGAGMDGPSPLPSFLLDLVHDDSTVQLQKTTQLYILQRYNVRTDEHNHSWDFSIVNLKDRGCIDPASKIN